MLQSGPVNALGRCGVKRLESLAQRITSKTHVTGRSLLLSSKSGDCFFPRAPVHCGMTRPRRDPPPDWRTRDQLLDRAEVASIMGASTNRVEDVVKRTHQISPRRSRWTPDVVIAALERLKVPEQTSGQAGGQAGGRAGGKAGGRTGTMGFLAGLPSVLTEAQVAHVVRCSVAAVPWLDLAPLPPEGRRRVHYALGDLMAWLETKAR